MDTFKGKSNGDMKNILSIVWLRISYIAHATMEY